MNFTCHKCHLSIPMRPWEFPLTCRCGIRYASAEEMDGEGTHVALAPPPLSPAELSRRIAICETCQKYMPSRRGCTICKTCGTGMAIYEGLLKDPTKRCPYPAPLGGDKWGESPFPPPIKVAFLTPGLTCGGAERWILSLCQNFDPAKVWVQAIGVEGAKHIDPMMRDQVPKHIRVVTEWENILPVAKAVDFLIVWGSPGMIDLAKASGKPFVCVVHGADETSSYGGLVARKGIEAGGLAACVNEACLACYPPEYRDSVTVIPNGADEERVRPINGRESTSKELGIGDGQKMLLYLGRIMKDKHVDKMLDIANGLPPEWVFVLAGNADGWGREKMNWGNAIARKFFKHIPPVNHVGDLLAAADVQILLSPSEAHPLSITEGWLAGVPTVVSDLPWIRSIESQHGPLTFHDVLEADAAGRGSEQVLHAQEVARLEFTAKRMAERWQAYLASKS